MMGTPDGERRVKVEGVWLLRRPAAVAPRPVLLLAAVAMICALTPWLGHGAQAEVQAAEWGAKPYEYMVVDQDLRTVLEEYGHNVGVRVLLTAAVQGRVRGSLPRSSARAFLDTLAGNYGLDWYFDGFAIHVSEASEAHSRLLDLHGVPFATLLDGVKAAGLFDSRFQLHAGPTPSMALVAGAPRFVEVVSETIAALAKKQAAVPSVLRVYRGATPVENVSFPDTKSE